MKTEVRFRDAGIVRGLIVGALKRALAEAGHRTATTVAAGWLPSQRTAAGGRAVLVPAGGVAKGIGRGRRGVLSAAAGTMRRDDEFRRTGNRRR